MQNDELFGWLRRGAAGNEILQRALDDARPGFEGCRVSDLRITVSAEGSAPDSFVIAVTNKGAHPYESLRVGYERLLLHAEHFGLDTTHMPQEVAWKPGEPLVIDVLRPGETTRLVRTGYGNHDAYDGPRETVLDLAYRFRGKAFHVPDRRWSPVTVDLPNARENT